jgi:predicted transcriptional regulator
MRSAEMSKRTLSISLPEDVCRLVEEESKRGRRGRSKVVEDALALYFALRRIPSEDATPEDLAAIAEGKAAYEAGEVLTLDEWRHAVGLADN